MKSIFVTLASFIVLINFSYSQDNTNTSKSKTQVKLHFLVPGASIEQYITKSISINYQLATDFAFSIGVGTETESELAVWPYLSIEPRFYIKGHEDIKNYGVNGAYFAMNSRFGFGTNSNAPAIVSGPLFGYKRQFSNNFYFDFGGGFGVSIVNSEYEGYFIGNVQLGFILDI